MLQVSVNVIGEHAELDESLAQPFVDEFDDVADVLEQAGLPRFAEPRAVVTWGAEDDARDYDERIPVRGLHLLRRAYALMRRVRALNLPPMPTSRHTCISRLLTVGRQELSFWRCRCAACVPLPALRGVYNSNPDLAAACAESRRRAQQGRVQRAAHYGERSRQHMAAIPRCRDCKGRQPPVLPLGSRGDVPAGRGRTAAHCCAQSVPVAADPGCARAQVRSPAIAASSRAHNMQEALTAPLQLQLKALSALWPRR